MSPRAWPSGPSKPAWRPRRHGPRAHDLVDLDAPGVVRLVLAPAPARYRRCLPHGADADRWDGGAGPPGSSPGPRAAGEGLHHYSALWLHDARDRALVG